MQKVRFCIRRNTSLKMLTALVPRAFPEDGAQARSVFRSVLALGALFE